MQLHELFTLLIGSVIGALFMGFVVVYCIARTVAIITTKFMTKKPCCVCEAIPADVTVGDQHFCYVCHFVTHMFDNDAVAKHIEDDE